MGPIPRRKAVFRAAVILLAVAMLAGPAGRMALAGQNVRQVRVIKVTARRFSFSPRVIRLKKDVPVRLEVRTADVLHGFSSPAMGIRADVRPGMVTKISFTPIRTGEFEFFCDIFCGKGHSKMIGKFVVEEADQP